MKTLISIFLLFGLSAQAEIVNGRYSCKSDLLSGVAYDLTINAYSIISYNEDGSISSKTILRKPSYDELLDKSNWVSDDSLKPGDEGIRAYRITRLYRDHSMISLDLEYRNTENESGETFLEIASVSNGRISIYRHNVHHTQYEKEVVSDETKQDIECILWP